MAEIPKGKIIPMYLTENGNLFPINFHDLEELNLCELAVISALGGEVVVDTRTQINLPQENCLSITGTQNR